MIKEEKPDPKKEPKGGAAGKAPRGKRPAGRPRQEADKHPPKPKGQPPKEGNNGEER